MQLSGLSKIHTDFGFGWQMTEGDNTVMAQQTSRYLLKKVQDGEIVLDEFEYDISNKLTQDEELLLFFEMRYKNQMVHAGLQLQQDDGKNLADKWNQMALSSLVSCTVYYCEYWMLKNFHDLIVGKKTLFAERPPYPGKLTDRPANVQKVMYLLFRNLAFFNITENTVSFFKNMKDEKAMAYFNEKKTEMFKVAYKKELEMLAMSLPEITDGYMFEDEQLLSVLGKHHTNETEMYEEMLETVRANPINKRAVAKGFNKYMQPIVNGRL